MKKILVLMLLLAVVAGAGEKVTTRQATLRKGAGAYYDAVADVARGTTVQVGDAKGRWVAATLAAQAGWLPEAAFQPLRKGIDYAGLRGGDGGVVVSSVDIAAATKGAFTATYAQKHKVNFDWVAQLDQVGVDPATVGRLLGELAGRAADSVLARLPRKQYDNNVVISPQAEALLGRALASHLLSKGLVKDEKLMTYVNSVAAVVGGKTDRYDMGYKVAVTDDDSVNGFGMPGGYVVLTRGLVRSMQNESELACAIGHEMAHASLHHGLREFEKRDIHRRRDSVFAELDELTGDDADEEVEDDLNRIADMAYLKIMGERAREDELEADLYGAAYAAAAGYDPTAMVGLLRRIGAEHGGQDVFRHHPPVATRVAELERAIDKYRLQWKGQGEFAERFAAMQGDAPQ